MNWITKRQTQSLIAISMLTICTFFALGFNLADAKYDKDPELRIAAFLVAKRLFIDAGFDKMIVYQRGEVIGHINNHHLYQDILRESSIRARAENIYWEKYYHNRSMGTLPYFGESPSAARDKYLNEQLGRLANNPTAKLSAQQVADLMIGFYAKQLNQLRKDLRTKNKYRGYKYLINSYFNEIWIESETLPVLLLMGVDLLRPEKTVSFTDGERKLGRKVSPKLFAEANKINEKDPETAQGFYRAVTWFTPESDPIHQKSLSHFKHLDEAEEKARIAAIVKFLTARADKSRAEKDYISEKWLLNRLLYKVPNHPETLQRLKQCEQDISNTSAEEWIQLTVKYYKKGRYKEAWKRLEPAFAMQGEHQPMVQALKKKIIRAMRFGAQPLDDIISSDKPSKNKINKPLKKDPPVPVEKSIWPFSTGQTWQGNYQCSFGNAALNLTIQKASSQKNTIEAIFEFNFLDKDAEGKYLTYGSYDFQKEAFVFTPGELISQIGKNARYGFAGRIEYGEVFTGKISYRYCKSFSLKLKDGELPPAYLLKEYVPTPVAKSIWPFESGQIWQGKYKCGKDRVAFSLSIKKASSENNTVKAEFDFNYLKKDVSGKYFANGRFDHDEKRFVFTPGKIISQVSEDDQKGLIGRVKKKGVFHGKVSSQNCTSFNLKLNSGSLPAYFGKK